jgi:hypothetical protein
MHISEIQRANDKAGYFFFEPATLKFFRSWIDSEVYETKTHAYFVTGERGPHQAKRLYTVRSYDKKKHDIKTAGEFQCYQTLGSARTAAKQCAKA